MSYELRTYRSPERAQDVADSFVERGDTGVRAEMNWDGWIITRINTVTHKKEYLASFGAFITPEELEVSRKI